MPAPPSSSSPADSPFDYVIVGSGAGGAPLAARMVENAPNIRVLVIEAGPDSSPFPTMQREREITEVPALHAPSTEDPDISWRFFVKHYENPAEPDEKRFEEQNEIFYPRATGVGGCTIHNAMITMAGPASDWDDLAGYLDDSSWRADIMRSYFQRMECCEYLARPGEPPRGWWGRLLQALASNPLIDNLLWLFGREDDPTGGRHGFEGWLHTRVGDVSLGLHDAQLKKMLIAAAETSALEGLESTPKRLLKDVLRGIVFGQSFVKTLDPNHIERQIERPEGLAFIPTAIYGAESRDGVRRGHRSSPRERLREVQAKFPDRLIIATDCLVTKVILEPDPDAGTDQWKATGVEYLYGPRLYQANPNPSKEPGKPGKIHVKPGGEVILAGGTFNTPQLLMLSGIGPKQELEQWKDGKGNPRIRCVVDSPGVGGNLQDRYEVPLISKMARDFTLLDGATFKLPKAGEQPDEFLKRWRTDGTGLYASNGGVIAILKRSRPELAGPDLFIFGIPLDFRGYRVGYSNVERHDLFSWIILKAHTGNRDGRLRLRSADPLDTPDINFHYFQENSRPGMSDDDPDLLALVEAVKFARRIADHANAEGILDDGDGRFGGEEYPGRAAVPVKDLQKIKNWIKRVTWGHHACGTCRMGRRNDPNAVLDSHFRVLGNAPKAGAPRSVVQGLRVVDASIFPKIPGYFIVANLYMASEKAADVLLADAAA